MTNGSSQGLFVIVAVVIFGIFVSISYLLFRDQLTHSLANIFEVSINQTQESLNRKENMVDSLKLYKHGIQADIHNVKELGKNHYELDNLSEDTFTEKNFFGIGFGKLSDFKSKTNYLFSFKVKVTEGELNYLAGHLSSSNTEYIKINGKKVSDNLGNVSWMHGVYYPFITGQEYTITIKINTLDLPEDLNTSSIAYIQPNRYNKKPTNYKLEVWDIYLGECG